MADRSWTQLAGCWSVATALTLSVWMLSGCGANGAARDDAARDGNATVRSGRSGLELRRWVLRGDRGQAERSLGVLARDGESTSASAGRWQQSGLRVAKVSEQDVDALRGYLASSSRGGVGVLLHERIEWLGTLSDWVPLHKGPVQPGSTAMVDSGPLQVDPGAVSLLGRAWLMPQLSGDALRVELVPQVPIRGTEGTVFVDGAPLVRQQFASSLASGEALIVFPAGRWDAAETSERADFGDPERAGGLIVGPQPPAMPTLGELMLVVESPAGEQFLEQVLVFIAHTPEASGQVEVIERGAAAGESVLDGTDAPVGGDASSGAPSEAMPSDAGAIAPEGAKQAEPGEAGVDPIEQAIEATRRMETEAGSTAAPAGDAPEGPAGGR